MKKIYNFISDIRVTVFLLLAFAVAIGVATFIENDFGTVTAQVEVYRARWFEILLGILTLNLITIFFKFKMYKFKKWSLSLFHLSFIIVAIGAFVTRYIGFEGTMHIREGESSNFILSEKTYLTVQIDGKEKLTEPKLFSNLTENHFSADVDGFEIELKKYIPYASYQFVKAENGTSFISAKVAFQNSQPRDIKLEQGESLNLFGKQLAFGKSLNGDIKIVRKGEKLILKSSGHISGFSMETQETFEFGTSAEIKQKILFQTNGLSIVFTSIDISVKRTLVSNLNMAKNQREMFNSAFIFEIKHGDEVKEMTVFGRADSMGQTYFTNIAGKEIGISYGAKVIHLPFSLKLRDFQLERYPGSMSPSSYASEVTLLDKNVSKDFRIYMNHILDYQGYRFFQSSYDRDELGTILSVNFDPGTPITYLGYLMMFIGMIASIFVKNGRFQKLRKSLEKFAVLIIAIPIFFHSTNLQAERIELEPLDTIFKFDKNHADNFGRLLVQDNAGRMKPLDSLNMELLHKIYRGSKVSGLNPNQVILGMLLKPELWKQVNLIYTKDPKVNQLLGVDKNSKYVSFNDCFEDPQTLQGYKLASHVSEALRMPPKKRGKLEKALLKIDERINISYMVYSGSIFRIFPRPNDPSHRWENAITAIQNFNSETSSEVRDLLLNYFQSVDHALKNGHWENADKSVQAIKNFQNKYGKDIVVNQTRIEAEIIYNKLEIFKNLLPYTFLIGFILLILGFVQIIKDIQLQKTVLIFKSLTFVIFTVFTAGMILRWYVSGHAPWSDAYESLLYIGWATLLAGLIFSRKSPLVLASTTILAGIILFVAHLNWLDPQITNLVPVLKSYWLTIHVSLITASYGFLGLGAVIGFIVLVLFSLKNKKNSERFEKRIIELNTINEMNLLAGLVLLTIGNFLGGIWANESWGRYWGWDPKETWALVTILVYSAIIHIKYISKAQTHYNFAWLSVAGLSSVIMTYFGVNFYLSGMHSYAQGDPVPIPTFVYYTILTIVITTALAYRNRKMSQE